MSKQSLTMLRIWLDEFWISRYDSGMALCSNYVLVTANSLTSFYKEIKSASVR